jgi:vitamin B12 transporter
LSHPLVHCAALAAAISLAWTGHARAQSTIVVTGTREPAAVDRLAADVVAIDAATIRATTADSLADLLRREAGVQLSRSGAPGQPSSVLIRGSGASQTVVLVDGVRVGSATLGFASLESIPLAQVERIEVLRGPGSSLYGADAVGGVVQIFTRRATGPVGVDAEAAIGGLRSASAALAVGGATAQWDASAALAIEGSDGVSALRPADLYGNYDPDRDGYRLGSGQGRIGYRPAPGHRLALSWLRTRNEAQYDASEYLPPDYQQDSTADFRNRTRTDVGALDWQARLASGVGTTVRIARSIDDARAGATVVDSARSTRDQALAQVAFDAGAAGRLVGALEAGEDRSESSSFGAAVRRRTRAAALSLAGQEGPWSWQAEARYDDISDFAPQSTWRLGGTWAPAPGVKLRMLAGSTFRAPTFNDLYFPGYGVPGLRPERGRSVEAGVVWTSADTEVSALAYRNDVEDLIGYEADRDLCPPDPSYAFGCARNVARARLQGATLAARHGIGALTLKAALDLLRATDEDSGEPLPRRAERQARVAAAWTQGAWTVQADLLHVGERVDAGRTLGAETTLDLALRWQLRAQWQLYAKLLNAGDADLEPARDYRGLGRQAWLGLRYTGRP